MEYVYVSVRIIRHSAFLTRNREMLPMVGLAFQLSAAHAAPLRRLWASLGPPRGRGLPPTDRPINQVLPIASQHVLERRLKPPYILHTASKQHSSF